MSVAQGGPGLPIFDNAVLEYFSHRMLTWSSNRFRQSPTAVEVSAAAGIYIVINVMCILAIEVLFPQLSDAKDHEIQAIFYVEDNATFLLETGYHKPLHTLKLHDVTDMCALLTDYYCMVKAEMDQFLEGLDMAGVAIYVKSHPHIMKPLLQYVPQSIDVGK